MNVLGFNASPGKGANTQTLVETMLAGAAEAGARTRMVNLRTMKIIGCIGYEGCKKQLSTCVDEMSMVPA